MKLQVRVSPNGNKSVGRAGNGRANRAANISTSNIDHPQSTNVSSPVQQAVRRRNNQGRHVPGHVALRSNQYDDDGFVVSDDEGSYGSSTESEGFEPVREPARKPEKAKRTAATAPAPAATPLGPPITTDDRVGKLKDVHRVVVEGFVEVAKKQGEKVRLVAPGEKQPLMNFRFATTKVFDSSHSPIGYIEKWPSTFPRVGTRTLTRDGDANWSVDIEEMLALPGIDADKVRRHGQVFCKMIKDAQRSYEDMMRESDDKPQDPNHEIVCISSGEDSDDAVSDAPDVDHAFEGERSEYFRSEQEVEAFNAQCKSLGTHFSAVLQI